MLPLQSLLNPVSPKVKTSCSRKTASASRPQPSLGKTMPPTTRMDAQLAPKGLASRNLTSPLRFRTQGPVRFPPYENVDARAMREVARYEINPFGHIQQCSEHIPYNSTKKNFYAKTGRESIEAFKYEFRIPGQNVAYKVMWDYNIGLVRMTPFFKCLGYPKTKPSQMLDKNPGLREVSPSITGGSVGAQGYWIPYQCARAVCATFCHDIAGALIPLFGPQFPLECTPPDSQFFGDMVIDHRLVAQAKVEAEISRNSYEMRRGTALTGSVPQVMSARDAYAPTRPLPEDIDAKGSQPMHRALWMDRPASNFTRQAASLSGSSMWTTNQMNAGKDRSYLDDDRILHPPGISSSQTHAKRAPRTGSARDSEDESRTHAESWSMKRRQTDPDGGNEAHAPARAKVARLSYVRPSEQRIRHSTSGDQERRIRDRGEDLAAAAVLVGLQKRQPVDAVNDPSGACPSLSWYSGSRLA